MQLRERKKGARWRDHPGKDKLARTVSAYQWRLLNKDKTIVLWPTGREYSTYDDVLQNLRRIEFFKRRKTVGSVRVDSEDDIDKLYPSGNPIPEHPRQRMCEEIKKVKWNQSSSLGCKKVFKKYKTRKKGGQRYKVRK